MVRICCQNAVKVQTFCAGFEFLDLKMRTARFLGNRAVSISLLEFPAKFLKEILHEGAMNQSNALSEKRIL